MNAKLNDDAQLEFTQQLRRQLIAQYMVNNKFPEDPKEASILLSAMKDFDKVTLTLRRLDVDTGIADADRQALTQFHRIVDMLGSKDPHRLSDEAAPADVAPPAFDPNDIPSVSLVPGELDVGPEPLGYDEIMDRMEKEHRSSLA